MSRDIRSYFTKANGNAKTNSKPTEVKPESKKKRKIIESDSEDDCLILKPVSKKQKEEKNNAKKDAGKKEKKKEVVVPVDLEKVFGKTPVKQKAQSVKVSEKPKEVKIEEPKKSRSKKSKKKVEETKTVEETNATESFFQDDDFDLDLSQIDDEQLGLSSTQNTPKKKTPKKEPVSNKLSPSPKKEPVSIKLSPSPKKEPASSAKKQTPKKEIAVVIEKKTPSTSKEKKNDDDNFKTPNRTPSDKGKKEVDSDQKRKNSEYYQRYLQRSGPKNPGSKKIPKGTPTCLQGKAFVITGVLDSLEREEAADLIQKCGGRITSAVSKKTDYVVVGEDAGVSKLDKAKKFGTKQLTEDELLDLVRSKSGEAECDAQEDVIEGTPPKTESEYFKTDQKRSKQSSQAAKKLKVAEKDFYGNKSPPGVNGSTSSGIGSSISSSSQESSQGSSSSQEGVVPEINLGDQLWVEKYKPKTTKQIIGQGGDKSNVKKLTKWLQDWHKNHSGATKKFTRPAPWATHNDDGKSFKAALLSGSPGVGKTTSVQLICKELGLDVIEFNASDTRSKRLLQEDVAELLSTKTIRGFFTGDANAKHVLVMDEVDGMAGNEDRGGMQELIQLIKNTKIPIICMCNDRNHQKIRSLVNYCFDLRFNRPRVEQIKAAMMSVCFKEGIKITGNALEDIIISSHQDVRQVLHNLSMWAVKNKNLTQDQVKIDAAHAKKPLNLGPWDVARKVFSSSDHQKMTLRDKEELFFQDYSLGPLFVQDTYLRVRPYKANSDKKKALELVSKAADSILLGDVVDRTIRSQNAWNLLPVQAIFSSVIPGHYMEGSVSGQIQFPAWLGKNSRRNKLDRLLQELQVHMRLSITGSKESVNLDYLHHIKDAIIKPLTEKGLDGVQEAVKVMVDYHLTREDLDSIVELTTWPNTKDPLAGIESKVKAAFTRAYNKEGKGTPYATNVNIKKTSVTAEAEIGDELEGVDEVEEDDDKVDSDAMIKKVKPKKPEKKADNKPEESTSKGKKGKGGSKESTKGKTSKKGKKK